MGIPLRLLLVEDSEDDALLLLRELRRGGYGPEYERVETAEAMREALQRRSWDLVVSDYVLPQFSGLAALAVYKESGLDLPFIMVSGNIGEDIAVEAMKAGAHDYIMKGNYTRLIPAIERELREAEVRHARRRVQEELDLHRARLEQMVAERTAELLATNERLQHALAEVKTLRGLLPICCGCKSIRNDQGYWIRLETYIHEHSDARFSHGLCPDCAEKLYPGLYRKKPHNGNAS